MKSELELLTYLPFKFVSENYYLDLRKVDLTDWLIKNGVKNKYAKNENFIKLFLKLCIREYNSMYERIIKCELNLLAFKTIDKINNDNIITRN